jgi:hypothetical protein
LPEPLPELFFPVFQCFLLLLKDGPVGEVLPVRLGDQKKEIDHVVVRVLDALLFHEKALQAV